MSGSLTIAVTGAGGFIGGRVCEYLHAKGHTVRPIVRSYGSGARLSVLGLPLVRADIMEPETLAEAFRGADAVVHCAYGNTDDFGLNEKINEEGTANTVSAAAAAGVKRLVHMSTVAVYGAPLPDTVTENTPYQPTDGDWYARSKLKAEQIVLKAASEGKVEAVALQPAIVYGPWAGVWTVEPVERIAAGSLYLYDNGSGICNTTFIDNLCNAVELACTREGVSGERFLITDGAPATWRDFFGRYGEMLGRSVPVASQEMVKSRESRKAVLGPAIKLVQAVGKLGASLLAAAGLKGLAAAGKKSFKQKTSWMQTTSSSQMEFYSLRAVFDCSHAREKLGYDPEFDLDSGMARTREWLRWARLIP